ncbi:MAG: PEP-CTERM sorting domain-containing protein [Planctomycetota bacterium]
MRCLQLTAAVATVVLLSHVATAAVAADYRFDTSSGDLALDSSGQNNHGTLVGFTDLAMGYADLSNVVPADDTGPVLIGSHMGSGSSEVWNGLIDRIRFSDAVVDPESFIPEPASLSLLGLGGLVLFRRKS